MSNISNSEAVLSLTSELNWLIPKDKAFAASLLAQFDAKKSLTDKQWFWVRALADRAVKAAEGETDMKTTTIGGFSGVVTLLTKAGKHLKRPSISLMSPIGKIKLSIAGPRAAKPGSINVVGRDPTLGNIWYGRVDGDTFEASRKIATPPILITYLKAMSADPAAVASVHGKLTSQCCFCNRALTTKESLAVGYGPDCSEHYGLPWGCVETGNQLPLGV